MSRDKIYAGLKGLTARDRKKWEKEIIKGNYATQEELDSMSDADLDEAFAADFLSDYYKGNRDVDIDSMQLSDAVNFYNAQYDMDQSDLNSYTVEEGGNTQKSQEQLDFEETVTYDKRDRKIDSMEDIFYDTLSDREKAETEALIQSNTSKNAFGFNTINYSNLFNADHIKDITKNYNIENFKNDPNYYIQVDNHASEIRGLFENDKATAYNAFLAFDNKAKQVSPEYRRFKDSEKLGLNAGAVMDIMSNYYSVLDLEGEEEANRFLSATMQDRLAKNQSLGRKYWEGFKGIGASAYGSMVALAGGLANIPHALSDEGDIEGLTGWQNFWNKVIDNDITRYAQDVMKYQTWNPNTIEELKDIGWDKGTIYKTFQAEQGDLADMVFNRDFIPDMISQHGFTVASALVSGGATMLLKGAGKLLTKGAVKATAKMAANKAAKAAVTGTAKAASAANKAEKVYDVTEKTYEWLRHYGDKIAGIVGASLAGTSESLTNALETKDEMLEKGEQLIWEDVQKAHDAEMEDVVKKVDEQLLQMSYQRMNTENPMTEEEYNSLRSELIQRYSDKFIEEYAPAIDNARQKLEKEAIQAQNTNFAFNQAITGAINNTLKATLMHPSVQKTWGKILGKNAYKVNESGNWLQKGWFYGRHMFGEMVGEGSEEALTEVTNAFSQGWHGSDFEHYLANGNHVVGQDVINNTWASCLWGGAKASWKSLLSKETAYSFIAGATGSMASTVNVNGVYDVVAAAKDPNATKADVLKSASSILFRSSIYEGYKTASAELEQAQLEKESIDAFMSDPESSKIHTSVSTMATYVSEMDASTDSELDYRNSKLGATVAEINALERIKERNPRYYAKVTRELENYKHLEEGSDEAKSAIEEYRNSGLADTNETDAEILQTIKSNAEKLSTLREKVLARKKVNERYYGEDVDPDIIDAITYGDIAYEEYKGRLSSMSQEIRKSYEAGIDETTKLHESSNLDDKTKEHIVKYGDFHANRRTQTKLESEVEKLEEQLEKLKTEKKKAKHKVKKTFDSKIERLQQQIKSKNETLKELNKSKEKLGEFKEDAILNEEDIMNLSIEDRAKVLSNDYYNNASKAQKEVIDNLKTILKNGDANTGTTDSYSKIHDSSKLLGIQKLHHEIRQKGKQAITNYGKSIKFNSAKRLSESRIKGLNDIQSFEEFETILNGYLNNPKTGFMNRTIAESTLKDNEFYKRWKHKNKIRSDYDNTLKRAFVREKLNDREEIISDIIIGKALADNEIEVTDIDSITESLLGNTRLDLDAYYSKFSEGRNDLPQLTFDDERLKRFIERLKSIKEMDAQTEIVQKPIEVDENASTEKPKDNPKVYVSPETKIQIKEAIKEIKEEILETVETDKFIEDSINSVFKSLSNNAQKTKFTNMLIVLAANKTADNKKQLLYKKVFNELVLHDLANLDLKTQQEIVERLAEGNEDTATELFNIITELTRVDNSDFKRDNSGKVMYHGVDITNDFNRITNLISQSLRGTTASDYNNAAISDVLGDSDNETLIQANTTHKINEYLRTHTSDPKAEVRFVPAFDLSIFASDDSFPIYMVIEDAEGTIEINGKKYQVIGVAASKSLGVTSTLQQRAKVVADSSMAEEGFPWQFVTDEVTNTPIVFKGFRIKNNSPQHVQKYEGNGTKISAMLDNEGMSVDTFISRMAHGNITTDESNVTTVSYISPYGDRATVTPKPLPSQQGKNRQYISYVEQTGKDPEKDTNNNGEAEIELFIDELKDMLLPNDRSFIDILNSDSNDIYNIDVAGYVVATYAQTLLNYAKSTIEQFSTSDFINNHTKVTSSGLKFVGLSEFDEEINKLNNALRRLLYIKDYTFKLKPIQQNGEITITLELSFGDSVIISTNIGTFKADENGFIVFEGTSNIDKTIHSFISDFTLNEDKSDMRRLTKDPLVKYQIDYQDIEDARKGISLTEKPTTMPELQFWVARKKIEEAIRRGILRTSKASLGRQGYRVEVNNTATPTTTKQPEVFTNGQQDEPAPKPLEVVKTAFEKALDKLVEAYKVWDKKRKEGTLEEGTIRVTTRNYNAGSKINDVVAAVGNVYDGAIRDVINDKANVDTLTSKYANLSKEEAQKIINIVEGIKEYLKIFPGNWKLDARNFLLSGQLAEKRGGNITEEGKNGKTELVTGSPDIVAYNEHGQVVIIDVKTYADTTLKLTDQSKHGWKGQTDDYKSLMEMNTGTQVIGTYILPIKVTYSKNASVIEDGTILEGAFPTQLNGELNTLGGTLLLPLNTTEEAVLSEQEKEQSQQCGNKTGDTPSPKKGNGPPPMPDLTDFS